MVWWTCSAETSANSSFSHRVHIAQNSDSSVLCSSTSSPGYWLSTGRPLLDVAITAPGLFQKSVSVTSSEVLGFSSRAEQFLFTFSQSYMRTNWCGASLPHDDGLFAGCCWITCSTKFHQQQQWQLEAIAAAAACRYLSQCGCLPLGMFYPLWWYWSFYYTQLWFA